MGLVLAACTTSSSASPSGTALPIASASPAGELRPIRLLLSYRPDVQFAPFYVAQQEGYFERAGLDVTIEHADGGDLIRLVADGQADFGVADATDVMIARTSGIPVKYISTLYQLFPVALIGPNGYVFPLILRRSPARGSGPRACTGRRGSRCWRCSMPVA